MIELITMIAMQISLMTAEQETDYLEPIAVAPIEEVYEQHEEHTDLVLQISEEEPVNNITEIEEPINNKADEEEIHYDWKTYEKPIKDPRYGYNKDEADIPYLYNEEYFYNEAVDHYNVDVVYDEKYANSLPPYNESR